MLDLRRLKSFVVVAEEGNLSRAAVRLHLSQPALTRRIQELEKELGFTLLEHLGRGIQISGEGRGFLRHCRDLVAHAEAVEDRARAFFAGESGVLRVGASPQMLERLFPRLLLQFAPIFPLVEVRLVEGTSRAHLRALERGEIDLAVIQPQRDDRFENRALPTLSVLAAIPNGHPLSRAEPIEIAALATTPVLLLHAGYISRQTFDAACRLTDFEPNVILESGAPQTILALAAAGLGIAIVPSTVRVDDPDLRVAPLIHAGAALRFPVAVCWNRRRHLPAYATGFVEHLVEVTNQELGPGDPSPGQPTMSAPAKK